MKQRRAVSLVRSWERLSEAMFQLRMRRAKRTRSLMLRLLLLHLIFSPLFDFFCFLASSNVEFGDKWAVETSRDSR